MTKVCRIFSTDRNELGGLFTDEPLSLRRN
jgi:hypothetical protein